MRRLRYKVRCDVPARSENVMKRDEDGLKGTILTFTTTQYSLK